MSAPQCGDGKTRISKSNPTGATQPVPRHREVNENTARAILRHLAAPDPDVG